MIVLTYIIKYYMKKKGVLLDGYKVALQSESLWVLLKLATFVVFIIWLCVGTIHQSTIHSDIIIEGSFFQVYMYNNKQEHGLRILSWTRYRPSAYFFLCGSIGGINWPFRLATLSINLISRRAANIREPCIIPFFLRLLYPFQSTCRFLFKFSVSLHFFQSILKSLFCHLLLPPASERKNLNAFYASSSYNMTGEISGFQTSECEC